MDYPTISGVVSPVGGTMSLQVEAYVYAVLYHTMLYSIVLYYTIFYHTILHSCIPYRKQGAYRTDLTKIQQGPTTIKGPLQL